MPEITSVNVTPAPTITVNDLTICEGESGTITAVPTQNGGTFLWSPGGETTSSISVSPSSTTNYTVYYTLNGCESSPETSSINVTPAPTITVNDLTICEGESGTITAVPTQSGGTFLWSPGGETTSSISVSPNSTTNYTVIYTLNGCESSSELSIVDVAPIPTITVNDLSLCEGETGTIISTSSQNGGNYLWSPGGESSPDLSVSPTSSTNYSLIYTLNGCESNSETSIVTVNPMPITSTSISGNTITVDQTGGTYQWLDCDQNNTPISNETNQNFSTTINGQYSAVINMNGCIDTTSCVEISDLGIDKDVLASTIVYPNPVNDILSIDGENIQSGMKYLILDLLGRKVQTGSLHKDLAIDVSQLESGSYSIRLESIHSEAIFFVKK